MKSYKLYKIISEQLQKAVGFSMTTPSFSCIDINNNEHEIEILECSGNKKWRLRSVDGYYLNDCSLKMIINGNFLESNKLFDTNGIVPENAILGLATKWASRGSNIQGVIQWDGDISVDSSPDSDYSLVQLFPAASLKGELILETFLYLKENNSSSKKFATVRGSHLGILDVSTFYLDGNGSVFPIEEINNPNEPLWKVYINSDNYYEDDFTENVSLLINKAHPGYQALNCQNFGKNSPIFNEIICSALLIIIQKCISESSFKELFSQEHRQNESYRGSIAQAVLGFLTNSGIKSEASIEDIALHLHIFIDQILPISKNPSQE